MIAEELAKFFPYTVREVVYVIGFLSTSALLALLNKLESGRRFLKRLAFRFGLDANDVERRPFDHPLRLAPLLAFTASIFILLRPLVGILFQLRGDIEGGWLFTTCMVHGLAFLLLSYHFIVTEKRNLALVNVAEELGLNIIEHEEFLRHFEATRATDTVFSGSSDLISHALYKETPDAAYFIFDFAYPETAISLKGELDPGAFGSDVRQLEQTVAVVSSNEVSLPALHCRPESIGAKIVSLAGYQDIDFSEDPSFSKAFILRGKDVSRIKKLFGPELRKLLLQRRDLTVEMNGGMVVLFRRKKIGSKEEIKKLLQTAYSLFEIARRSP